MKLYSLGRTSSAPCHVLQFKGASIMLDCSLDMSTLQHFMPLSLVNNERTSQLKPWITRELQDIEGFSAQNNLKEIGGKVFIDEEPEICPPEDCLLDFSTIDIIVISNYHFMLALPFITEHSGFKGKIYATEPTVQIGRELMLEMVVYAERVPKVSKGNMWKDSEVLRCLPHPLCDLKGTKSWKVVYSKKDVKASISKIQNVGYSERIDLFGILKLTPLSSGYCLGSCNWVIESDYEKVSYISCSSTFTTHPLPMDQSMLKNSDALILTGITQAPLANPDAMLGEFCSRLATTLRNGGNVLVPCCPSGVLYDLFECLYSYMDGANLSAIPIYFISPVADSSLAYSNIFAEWLCQSKQSKVYLPEPPFPHAELVKANRLKHFPSIHDGLSSCFKTPCVVFTGHPSLRYGDVVHFMELWGKSNGNTVIFTEPEFPYLEALAPYQPLAMKACYCPIDPRLNFTQANKLIRELQPGQLAIPEAYTRAPDLLPHKTDLTIQDTECKISTFSHLDVLSLSVKREFEKVVLSNELANGLHPQEVRPGIAVTTVTGTLVSKDNRYTLEPLDLTGDGFHKTTDSKAEPRVDQKSCHLWGSVLVEDLIKSLAKRVIEDVNVDSDQWGHTLHLTQHDAMIQLDRSGTHIITHGNEALRIEIRDSLLECVSQF
ncbi:integrator complex subunit 9 homolog [Stylophora pistillata]|uniref:integrator complex subunit 9 homolog n=1 Tax=Stylophora pistillata TaxID=50429 RepID=UPI000C04D667|nr:integrator complex subunit 9 homolog [Stylophora pistillata]